ncbi:hypothetical protein [Streptomyces scabrisporus]|uniref:hypothetical protein n=1 Tax=Embleya scabrispora TaxID=159449 RepID=UPI00037146BA
MSARERLARQQSELLAALVAGGPTPAGFDPQRIRAQARALAAKRRDSALRAVPELASALGPRWPGEFMTWALVHPKPADGGTRADVHAFAAHLWERGALPTALAEVFMPRESTWWGRLRARLGHRT